MKYTSILCFLSALLFINVSSAAFIRVINAVPESRGMDVWVLTQQNQQVQNQNQNQSQSNQTQVTPEPAIRLFQNVTYGDIPPYFFITDKSTPWMFMFSNATNQTQLSASQVQMLQNFSTPLQPNNNYTLIVASGAQGSTDGSSNFQYLLLTDRLTGQEQPVQSGAQTVYVRLLNVATPGQLVTLISGGSCPSNASASGNLRSIKRSGTVAGVVTQSGRPMQTALSYAGGVAGTLQSKTASSSQSQAQTGSASYAGGVVGTVQSKPAESTQPEASPAPSAPEQTQPPEQPTQPQSNIIATAAYLRPGAYVPLPANANREQLTVCVGGQAYPVFLAASYRGDSIIYSVVVFQYNSQSQDAILKRGRLMREEGDYSIAQPQLLNQTAPLNQTGGVVAFITDDIPLAVNNSRIRTIHAASQVPPVDVYIDGQLLFSSVNYATVTMYQRTYRGLHNITIVPSQGSQNQNENSTVQFPYTFLTFLAWDRFYTLAILPTGVFMMQGQNQNEQSGDNLVPTKESGFLGPLHRIFLDDFAPNAALTSGVAYVQIVHLAPNAGAVTANVSGTPRLLLPLENTFYYPIRDTNSPIALMLLNSMQGQQGQGNVQQGQEGQQGSQNQGTEQQGGAPILVSRSFQPNTLYTIFVLDAQEGNNQVNAIIVRDRSVLINCRALQL